MKSVISDTTFILLEMLMWFGGFLAFGLWQIRSVKKAQAQEPEPADREPHVLEIVAGLRKNPHRVPSPAERRAAEKADDGPY